MNYKGFTICKHFGGWMVIVDCTEQWLATSEADARQQVDEHLARMERRKLREALRMAA